MSITHETNWELIVSGEELKEVAVSRIEEFIKMSVETARLDEYLSSGWSIKKQNKKKQGKTFWCNIEYSTHKKNHYLINSLSIQNVYIMYFQFLKLKLIIKL